MERILTLDLLNFEQKKMLVKQLFTSTSESETSRLNYLLISSFEKIFTHELKALKLKQDDSPFYFDEDCTMISIYIFQVIFESNQTNMDTICCIACHIINKILTKFS